MSDAYAVLWTQDRCRRLTELGQVGAKLKLLFGGPHLSQPRFSRFGVKKGDYIYPVHVNKGVLHLLARMKVKQLLTLEAFIAANPKMFAGLEDPKYPACTLDNWVEAHPENDYLVWSCTDEVCIGQEGTSISFDVALSPEELEGLRFRSKKGERGLKYIKNGKLQRVAGLDGGVYRLSPESAALFMRLVGHSKVRRNGNDGCG